MCDLPQGDRCYAKILDLELLVELEAEEGVGRAITLVRGDTAGIPGVPATVNVLRA